MSFEEVKTRVVQILEPFLEKQGLELIHLEYRSGGAGHLCCYIDKPGGVTLVDCEAASRGISDLLDAYDPIPQSFILEVSSPGVERPLTRAKDFERFRGEAVKVHTDEPIDGRKNFKGILEGIQENLVALLLEEGDRVEIPLEHIKKAHLLFNK